MSMDPLTYQLQYVVLEISLKHNQDPKKINSKPISPLSPSMQFHHHHQLLLTTITTIIISISNRNSIVWPITIEQLTNQNRFSAKCQVAGRTVTSPVQHLVSCLSSAFLNWQLESLHPI